MVILQKLQSLFKVLVYETSGTIASLALETSRNAKKVHYFQGKNRVIREHLEHCLVVQDLGSVCASPLCVQ